MKSLVLAEKPSVAKELARVLNCNKKNKGFYSGSQYLVTWALGHLVTLAVPEDYDKKWKEWRMEDLPIMPRDMRLKVIKKTGHQFRTIKHLMQSNDVGDLVIATDAGREGELVARWIMKLSSWRKPVKRLWISSQTDGAIREGFAALKPGKNYDNLYYAAVCRSEADWIVGLNVTRALSCKFNASLNAGRVQTPTLAMMVTREQEIQQFKPVPYWTIRANFGDYFGDWRNANGNGRIFNITTAQEIVDRVQTQTGVVKEVRSERQKEQPPLAYDLTELQRDANRRYGFSAKKTLSLLQNLYERHKLVTYPRTDSRFITTDMVPTLTARLKAMSQEPYTQLITPLLSQKLHPGKRFVNNSKVSDHHAIIPTEQPLQISQLGSDERKIYDLIARRFLAVLYPPASYTRTSVITEVNNEKFYSRGKVVDSWGWKAVSSNTGSIEGPSKEVLPEQSLQQIKQGTKVTVAKCKTDSGKTQPPARYTEATLLSAMEGAGKFIDDEELRESIKQGGLGTPATRAEIIEKLIFNNYIERRGNQLVPTSKATQLIKLVPQDLKSPELTAKWELRLSNIAQGKESQRHFMADIRKKAVELVQSIREDNSSFKLDNVSKTKCPMCGEYMLIVNEKKRKVLVCQDRVCGYRQEENPHAGYGLKKRSRQESRINKALISKYSDKKKAVTNVGDLLKEALEKTQEEK